MLVFEDQLDGILNMMHDKKMWKDDKNFNERIALNKYFVGFCCPPSTKQLKLLIDNTKTLEIVPQIHFLKNRKSVDPYYVVQKLKEEQLDVFEVGSKIYDESDIARDLFSSKEKYIMELCRVKVYDKKSNNIGIKIEELPIELISFNREPYYNLDELVQEVKDEMFGGNFEGISSIVWTDKAYRTYYGIHYYVDNSIKINSILNSKDVPREVVKFVIYHELLHRDYHSHDKVFRVEEHKYPKFEECEHFLYDNMVKFDIEEW